MMDATWLLILLPLAALGGWLFARQEQSQQPDGSKGVVPSSVLKGLNQLLSQQDDKALKTFLALSRAQPDYPEFQLTLGHLSRKTGEYERATTIHQAILNNPVYSDELREIAAFELAKDFYAAGLYDRAEELFLPLKHSTSLENGPAKYLLEIYQHQKDWLSAIGLLRQNANLGQRRDLALKLIHYYCERAAELIAKGEFKPALACINDAQLLSDDNPRVITLQGKISAHRARHSDAVEHWKKLQWHEPHYLGEVIGHLGNSYEILGKQKEFIVFLKSALQVNPDPRLLSQLLALLNLQDKPQSLKAFVQQYLRGNPTLGGVHQLMTNWLELPGHKLDQNAALIVQSIAKLIENQHDFACSQCGFSADEHHWQCPACQQWEVIKPSHLLSSELPSIQLSEPADEALQGEKLRDKLTDKAGPEQKPDTRENYS